MSQTIFNIPNSNIPNPNTPNFNVQIGIDTIAGRVINQDSFCVIHKPEINCYIFMVADGHSKDTGQIASQTCTETLKIFTDENIELLQTNPVLFLENYYTSVHQKVRESFVAYIESKGDEANIDSRGIVSSRKKDTKSFKQISGGATLSVSVFINNILYSSNVGDSSCILFSNKSNLQQSMMKYEKDAADEHRTKTFANAEFARELVLTAEHSPDSSDEYIRIRNFRNSELDKNQAELLFVYDITDREKPLCSRIFDISEDGTPTKAPMTEYYYKNVKKDPATYVSVPFNNDYPDAVAFTRSIGDFNITAYGVSEKPEIHSIDMNAIFMNEREIRLKEDELLTDGGSEYAIPIFCLVLATDGYWDNWTNEIAGKFIMDPSCLRAINTNPTEGAQKVAKSFGQRNLYYANKNFGSSKDDQTCIVAYISQNTL